MQHAKKFVTLKERGSGDGPGTPGAWPLETNYIMKHVLKLIFDKIKNEKDIKELSGDSTVYLKPCQQSTLFQLHGTIIPPTSYSPKTQNHYGTSRCSRFVRNDPRKGTRQTASSEMQKALNMYLFFNEKMWPIPETRKKDTPERYRWEPRPPDPRKQELNEKPIPRGAFQKNDTWEL